MKNLRYTLGLDIGIASCGWAVLANDKDGEPVKIENFGSRVFEKAENPKDGAPLALPRREARGARRVLRRRHHRKERIKYLLEQSGVMTVEEQNEMFAKSGFEKSVYELRALALDYPLTNEEAVRLLIHYAQRRGYKSNSKSEELKQKDNGKVKKAISEMKSEMAGDDYRTVGEMLWKNEKFHGWVDSEGNVTNYKPENGNAREYYHVHNAENDYTLSFTREMLQEEINTVFDCQIACRAPWATEDLKEKYIEIWASQRDFDEGPGNQPNGEPSPYGGNQIENMLGECRFEKGEPRAPKAAYTAEYFKLLQNVNKLKLKSDKEDRYLTPDEKKALIARVFKSENLKYADVRKLLNVPDDYYFNALNYGKKEVKDVEKAPLKEMHFYHQMRKAFDKKMFEGYTKALADNEPDKLDEIARIVTIYKSDKNRLAEIEKAGLDLPPEIVDAVLGLSATKSANLSVKAMKKLTPYLEKGLKDTEKQWFYSDACKAVYGDHSGKDPNVQRSTKLKLADAGDIRNPVVKRAVSQTIKVVNAVVREYGPPEVVRVELAREVGKSFEERGEITTRQQENQKANERIFEEIKQYKATPKGLDIVKYKLFKEQDGICLYSGKNLDFEKVFTEPGYAEVDHILPYSKTYDDSYSNKVLVLASENQKKKNRTPFEYFGDDPERWSRFEALVEGRIKNKRKKKNLYKKYVAEKDTENFKKRNLNDTQYISRVVKNLLNDHLQFNETGVYNEYSRVQSVNGKITSTMRKGFGIEKERAEGDLHHAVDAVVIACVSTGVTQKITRFYQLKETAYYGSSGYLDKSTGEMLSEEQFNEKYKPKFPEPWPEFRTELTARLSDDPTAAVARHHFATYGANEVVAKPFVSRMPNRKAGGEVHEETIRSGKKEGYTIAKKDIKKLKLDESGEIVGYYNKESDRLLYNALKAQLEKFGGDGKKAFAEPFYKPKANGENGPLVKKVKVEEKATITVNTGRGVADNGRMIRVDVFFVNGKGGGYYYVPVYTSNLHDPELPNRAVVAHKSRDEWPVMEEENFLFSIYQNDLLYIRNVGKDGSGKIKLNLNKKAVEQGLKLPKQITVKEGFFYYDGLNISTGNLGISTHDRRYDQAGIGGKTLNVIEKRAVDVLGNVTTVENESKRQKLN